MSSLFTGSDDFSQITQDPLRIALILPSFVAGGAERVLLNFAADLADRPQIECHVIVFDNQGPLLDTLTGAFVVHDLQSPRLRGGLFALRRCLAALRPDAVFSTMVHTNLGLLALRPFLPRQTALVVREANLPSVSLARLRFSAMWRVAVGLLYPVADRVIASSELMARELTGSYRVKAGRLAVLANPVDEDGLRERAKPPKRSPGTGRRFVAAGRLVHQKGFDQLVAIAGDLPPEDEIVVFGEGDDRAQLEDLAVAAGARVRFAGHSSHLPAWLAGADALLMPSRFEGLPNIALEALACGTLVIATPQSGGIAEIAASAPSGAVRLAEMGGNFLTAMLAIDPMRQLLRPRESLLPQSFRRAAACTAFLATLEAAIAERQDGVR